MQVLAYLEWSLNRGLHYVFITELVISPKMRAAIELHVREVRQRIGKEVGRLFVVKLTER